MTLIAPSLRGNHEPEELRDKIRKIVDALPDWVGGGDGSQTSDSSLDWSVETMDLDKFINSNKNKQENEPELEPVKNTHSPSKPKL